MDVSVVGLGRLGSSFAASVAHSGIDVRGVDIDRSILSVIEDGRAPFPEPYVEEYIRAAGDRLSVTPDVERAVPGSAITFVFVNTYSEQEDGYCLDAVEQAVRDVGRSLSAAPEEPLVVIRCTVMPGDCTGRVRRWLEAESSLTVGEDLHLCYWPEFTALGGIVEDMENPDFRLIGQDTPAAGDLIEAFLREWSDADTPVCRMGLTSAEVTKMAVNTYVATKMSFANGLGQICQGVGADVDDVTEAMARDPRISGRYMTAGVRYGGPCFPHDNEAFDRLADRAGVEFPLARAADSINARQTDWIVEQVDRLVPDRGAVGVLGLTYKPDVPVITESQGIELVRALAPDREVIAFDRVGLEAARASLDTEDVTLSDDLRAVISEVEAVVVTLPEDEAIYDHAAYEDVTVLDPWRNFDSDSLSSSVTYHPLPDT
jgi:UDPglucose 6-dehydrogenase